jgi:hypothetical protein
VKARDRERAVGKLFLQVASLVAEHPYAHWYGAMSGGGETELCKVVGVMMPTDDAGVPDSAPCLVLESVDGRRLYTCTHARMFAPDQP